MKKYRKQETTHAENNNGKRTVKNNGTVYRTQ